MRKKPKHTKEELTALSLRGITCKDCSAGYPSTTANRTVCVRRERNGQGGSEIINPMSRRICRHFTRKEEVPGIMSNPHATALGLRGIKATCLVCAHFSGTPLKYSDTTRVFCGSRKEYVPVNKAPNCPGFTTNQTLFKTLGK